MRSALIPRRFATGLAVGATALALVGCSATTPVASPTPTPVPTSWSYDGDTGPDSWGAIAAACAGGPDSHESPVNIDIRSTDDHSTSTAPVLHFQPTRFTLENNGHAIEAVPEDPKANWIELDGTTYYLQQFHFHVSSEHTVDDAYSAAELHLVNKSEDGSVAVIGVLLDLGDENAALGELLDSVPVTPTADGDEIALTGPIDPSTLVPAGSKIARYDGSLTTPPCTEGVKWSVYVTPTTISTDQLDALSSAYPNNSRPLQILGDREIDLVQG